MLYTDRCIRNNKVTNQDLFSNTYKANAGLQKTVLAIATHLFEIKIRKKNRKNAQKLYQ